MGVIVYLTCGTVASSLQERYTPTTLGVFPKRFIAMGLGGSKAKPVPSSPVVTTTVAPAPVAGAVPILFAAIILMVYWVLLLIPVKVAVVAGVISTGMPAAGIDGVTVNV